MFFYIAFLLLTVPILNNAQEHGLNLYDMHRYPASHEVKISFEHAKYKLAQNALDEKAINTLSWLAGGSHPYIPAVRLLAGHALEKGDRNEALKLLQIGSLYYDLPCMHSQATLLLNADKVPNLAQYDPMSVEICGQEMLWHAAQTMQIPRGNFYLPIALEHWNRLEEESQMRLRDAFEKSLNRIPLHTPEHARASFFLGWLDYHRLEQGEAVDIEKLERNLEIGSAYDARALLMLASYAAQPKDMVDYLNRITNRLDTLDQSHYSTVVPDIINLCHAIMQKGEHSYASGLITLLKHKSYAQIREQLATDPIAAQELGTKLVQMRDQLVESSVVNRNDRRKVRDAGIELWQAAAEAGNDQAAWKLVEQDLQDTGSLTRVLFAIECTENRIKEKQVPLLPADSLQTILSKVETAKGFNDTYRHAFAHWLLNGIEGYLERDQEKAVHYLAQMKNPITQLRAIYGQLNDSRACLKAAILAHQQSKTQDIVQDKDVLCILLFSKAILTGDLKTKKEIAKYALQHRELVSVACDAIAPLYEELAVRSGRSQEEADAFRKEVIQPLSNELMKWAVGTHYTNDPSDPRVADRHPAAIMFFNEPLLLNIFDEADQNRLKELAEWAAINGFPQAIDAMESKFSEAKKEVKEIMKATAYWTEWFKLYGAVAEDDARKIHAYKTIKRLSDWAMEPKEKEILFVANPRAHYQLAQILMANDPVRAVNHIIAVEEMIKLHTATTPELFAIIDSSGMYDLLQAHADQKIPSACYALACVELNRLDIFVGKNYQNVELCFAQINRIKTLFEQAKAFDVTQLDARWREDRSLKGCPVLTLAQIEFQAALACEALIQLREVKDEAIAKRGMAELEGAANKNYPDALFSWAHTHLQGKGEMGQPIFEKAIDYLCRASLLNVTEASALLENIYKKGFGFKSLCQGMMTKGLRERIEKTLCEIGRLTCPIQNQLSENSPITTFEQAIADLNKQENLTHVKTYFEQLSQSGDVRGYTYLGLMYKNGIGVEPCRKTAHDYFTRALRDCRNKPAEQMADLLLAYDNLDDTDTFESSVGRLCYIVEAVLSKMIGDSKRLNEIISILEKIDLEAIESHEPQKVDYIFQDGLVTSLINVSMQTHDLAWHLGLVRIFSDRLLRVGISNFKGDSSKLTALTMPFALLRDRLETALFNPAVTNKVLLPEHAPMVTKVIHNLEKLVESGYQIPFEETLGLLKLLTGVEYNKMHRETTQGLQHLRKAYEKGDFQAGILWATYNLLGIKRAPHLERSTPAGIELLTEIQNKVKKSLADQDKIQNGDRKEAAAAAVLLGKHYIMNAKKPAEAAASFQNAFDFVPQSPEASFGLLRAWAAQPSCLKNNVEGTTLEQRVQSVVEAARKSKEYEVVGPCYHAHLLLAKNGKVDAKWIIDTVVDSCQKAFCDPKGFAKISELLLISSFRTKYEQVVQSLLENKLTDTQLLSRAYEGLAWLNFILGKLNREMKKPAVEYFAECLNACEHAIRLAANGSVEAECIKAWYWYDIHAKRMNAQMPIPERQNMKKALLQAYVALLRQDLTREQSPILNFILDEYKHTAGGITSGVIQLSVNDDPKKIDALGNTIRQELDFVTGLEAKARMILQLEKAKLQRATQS